MAGFHLVASGESCDICILNACTVTATADAKVRHLLRLTHRFSPHAALVLTGCYGESAAAVRHSMPGATILLCRDKTKLVPMLRELGYGGTNVQSVQARRTRAFVKAQEGCNNFCAYCIVPHVRGREKSRAPGDVVSEVANRVREGYLETVLTGTEIGAYRCRRLGLVGLLRRILKETEVGRLRLSSLQPTEITPELLKLWSDSRLCPHFHLSLQSGSDGVLQRMGRHYDTAGYLAAVERIRAVMPEAAITTDVIVGFPGETDGEFEESYRFCSSLGFARIHVFTFSPRPGTPAAVMPAQISAVVGRERSRRMLGLARDSANAFHTRFFGRTLSVLWESENDGVLAGYTENYIRVYARIGNELINQITAVKLIKPYQDGVWGSKI